MTGPAGEAADVKVKNGWVRLPLFDDEPAEGYFLIFWIALIGLVGVLVIVGVIALRRATRRSLDAIERGRAERRAAKSIGRVDAWSAGAERYVDHDKLPEQVPYDTESDAADPAETEEEDPPDPALGDAEQDAEPEDDPYGLFDDKPYRDPEDEDDEEEWDDGDEEDGRR